MDGDNLLAPISDADAKGDEVYQPLLDGGAFKLERIVSAGQTTPAGKWYDQSTHEWVVLLSGSAKLRLEGRDELLELSPGDCVNIPAHLRHRVEYTDPNRQTVWLALHYS
ncbi:MAG: cupin domain-containing protein [Pirellulaceae bacterium]